MMIGQIKILQNTGICSEPDLTIKSEVTIGLFQQRHKVTNYSNPKEISSVIGMSIAIASSGKVERYSTSTHFCITVEP